MSLALSFAMFSSGAAALIFETLWFRQAGLVLGNGVWASSLTMAAFMVGLAIGNGIIARHGERVRNLVRLYAQLEVTIAVTGIALVWSLPLLAGEFAPLWRSLLDYPLLLNAARLVMSFTLLLIPAIAMGATLPLLVKLMLHRDPNFGSVLGRLYGWNTLGAVVGDLVLLDSFGVGKTAFFAGGLNVVAAIVALGALSRIPIRTTQTPSLKHRPLKITAKPWRPLAAVFLSGGIVLALEVIWFRFLELFVWNSGASFALMLAVVLAGIGAGGRVAGFWLRTQDDADRFAGPVAIMAGIVAVTGYLTFSTSLSQLLGGPQYTHLLLDTYSILALSISLTFPVSFLSGILFTLVGAALHRSIGSEMVSTGLLTLSNTLGGAVGALAGGFLLLPLLGIEQSLFMLSALYGVVGLLLFSAVGESRVSTWALRIAWNVPLAIALFSFPFGDMRGEHLKRVSEAHGLGAEASIAVVRETRTETLILLRRQFFGETLSHLLVTGGFGMASTDEWSRRYMKQFVYLPLNLHPDPKRALLISFGSGSTAQALHDVESLEAIEVVDISRDVLSLSDIVYPEMSQNPLADRRVSTHVGDGRFFLLTTNDRYDLITSEPPPPKHAGVGSLYTQEFFALVKDRLTEGGINTHWLPTHALTYDDTRAITRAYCEVFKDCTLWKGTHLNWMLMGSRNARWKTSEADFRDRFEKLSAAREGHALGVENPEQIGAMFLADHHDLQEWTRDVLPFKDGYPKRVVDAPSSDEDRIALRQWMRPEDARRRFIESEFIANAWPEDLRERSKAYFRYDGFIDDVFLQNFGSPPSIQATIEVVDAILQDTDLERLPAWLLGSHGDYIAAMERQKALYGRPISQRMRGREAIGRRDYAAASKLFRNLPKPTSESIFLDAYATAMRGEIADASAIVSANHSIYPAVPWTWLVDRFDLTVPGRQETARGPNAP